MLGAGLHVAAWFLTSIGFSVYIAYFAACGATYGSLGAASGLLFYLYPSVAVVTRGGGGQRHRPPPGPGRTVKGGGGVIGSVLAPILLTLAEALRGESTATTIFAASTDTRIIGRLTLTECATVANTHGRAAQQERDRWRERGGRPPACALALLHSNVLESKVA